MADFTVCPLGLFQDVGGLSARPRRDARSSETALVARPAEDRVIIGSQDTARPFAKVPQRTYDPCCWCTRNLDYYYGYYFQQIICAGTDKQARTRKKTWGTIQANTFKVALLNTVTA